VREFLATKQITVLEHPAYSPDLAPKYLFSVPEDKGNIERRYKTNNQLDATKCWFIFSTCFEHYYAHLQEYISEYQFLVSKPVSHLGCVAQSC
jgi:hypothetical protein